jgi:hypothetical protein
MTTEKAIEFGKIFLKTIADEKGSATYEFVETAIKIMEQEPCDDAISRKALFDMCKKEIDHISKNWQNYHSPSEAKSGFAYIATNIYDLPPVTPQPKTGHWIDKFGGEYRCSCCREIISIDTEIEFPNGITYKYCPNCGCRMKGVE